jgi:hypothetical protein
MTRIRILCKAPTLPPPTDPVDGELRYPKLRGVVASWPDTYIWLVDDDGKEHPITNCTGATWHATQGSQPAHVTLSFIGIDIEAEACIDMVCSFCGKTQREVKKMVASTSSVVVICDECVGLATDMVKAG